MGYLEYLHDVVWSDPRCDCFPNDRTLTEANFRTRLLSDYDIFLDEQVGQVIPIADERKIPKQLS